MNRVMMYTLGMEIIKSVSPLVGKGRVRLDLQLKTNGDPSHTSNNRPFPKSLWPLFQNVFNHSCEK